MMLKNYTKTRVEKLAKLNIADISVPIRIQIYWLTMVALQDRPEYINRQMHKHAFYEAHFILNGSSEYADSENNHFTISAGEGILFTPDTDHLVTRLNQDALRFSITFLPEKGSLLDNYLSQKNIWRFPIDQRIIECIDVILYEADQKSFFSSSIIQNRVFDTLCVLSRTLNYDDHVEYVDHDSNPESIIIAKAKQYIYDNREKMLECQEVAAYCHFNPKYLSSLFVKQTKQTLLEYIHNEKIKYAEELLADSSLTLKQISQQLGFSSEYYFNNFFKRMNGIPPGHFRKLLAKSNGAATE